MERETLLMTLSKLDESDPLEAVNIVLERIANGDLVPVGIFKYTPQDLAH